MVNTSARVVLDGQGLVTLSGAGRRRILYQYTCDPRQTCTWSTLRHNPSDRFETLPGIFFLGKSRTITHSVVK